MKNSLNNLAAACAIFTEDFDLSVDQNLSCLDSSIEQGYIDKKILKEEFKIAFSNPNFAWLEFAIETRLIVYNIENYNNDSVKKYIKSLIWDYLYSD